MDNSKRAEKIARLDQNNLPWDKFVEMVTTQIDEAVREAERTMLMTSLVQIADARTEGFVLARGQAARIVESLFFQDLGKNEEAEKWLAERIRALEPKP